MAEEDKCSTPKQPIRRSTPPTIKRTYRVSKALLIALNAANRALQPTHNDEIEEPARKKRKLEPKLEPELKE